MGRDRRTPSADYPAPEQLASIPLPWSAAASFLLQFLISFRIYLLFYFCKHIFCFFIFSMISFGSLRLALVYFDSMSRHCHGPGLEMMPAELTEDSSNTPNLVIIGISLAAFGFLLVNAALVAWFFVHQRRKKGSLTWFLFI